MKITDPSDLGVIVICNYFHLESLKFGTLFLHSLLWMVPADDVVGSAYLQIFIKNFLLSEMHLKWVRRSALIGNSGCDGAAYCYQGAGWWGGTAISPTGMIGYTQAIGGSCISGVFFLTSLYNILLLFLFACLFSQISSNHLYIKWLFVGTAF